jgi:hypothetical protein
MNKKLLFVIAFITTLSLASFAGMTQAAVVSPPQDQTSQTASLSGSTTVLSNATLLAQLDNLVNSENFKQATAKWSSTKNAPHAQYQLATPDFPYHDYYVASIYASSPPKNTGYLYYPERIIGASDVTYAHFHTEVWRPQPDGDEAILVATMQAAVTGDIWLTGYTGQYPTSDVFVFGSNDPNLPMTQWMAIGYAHFTQHTAQSVYAGTTSTAYRYLAVFAYAYTQAPFTQHNDAYVDCVTIVHDSGGGYSYISTSATADVAISPSQESNGDNVISWVCADDYGAYYCHLTDVYIDGNWYSPSSFGDDHTGSITFTDYGSHTVDVVSAPDYYPVTFNQYAHNDNFGDTLVNSWTEYHVAWEEVGGPHYSHGSDLHGGGGEDYYVDSAINDPWGWGTDYFNYAMSHNWGGGSETYYYGIPLNVWTFTWGNTVDIYYNYG